jgi:regulator of PEP synthase PpsR (kinase-PPPase family)
MLKNDNRLYLYLVSDSSGETVFAAAKAVASQFKSLDITEYMWPLVRDKKHIDQLITDIKQKKPGIVIYTIINPDLRDYLVRQCANLKVECISPIEPTISAITRLSGVQTSKTTPDKEIFSDESYLKRMDAINFAIKHNDGQNINNYNTADILILGVSRTSKSPTSFYLAQRGYKVANWPIIYPVEYDLAKFNNPLIVGLTVSLSRLLQVRTERFSHNNYDSSNEYTHHFSVKRELQYAEKLFKKNNIPTVNVTSKAVEEIAAEIINLNFQREGAHTVKF